VEPVWQAIDDDFYPFGFNALNHSLDAAGFKVIGASFHNKAMDFNYFGDTI
jgi:hypothetical protein